MTDLKNKLDALLKHKGVHSGAQWKKKQKVELKNRRGGAYEINAIVPGESVGQGGDAFYRVRHDFTSDHQHGFMPLNAFLSISPEHIAFSACDPDLNNIDPSKTCFIDTETTGLAGGAGTVPFLVGVGYFEGDTYRLDQYFMRDYHEEEPMLEHLDTLFKRFDTVVTYNGKSFDLPLLRTRFIQNRIPFRLEGAMHLDLVHVARRFLKMRLEDCTLGTVEREVLGIQRQDDVPSHLIPQMWFDYLRSRDARPLEGVFYHHQMDILSLVSLTAWFSQGIDGQEEEGFQHSEDRFSLIRAHFKQKDYQTVIDKAVPFLADLQNDFLKRFSLELLGLAYKRRARYEEMEDTFEKLVENFPTHVTARIELAKHHEHRSRNLKRAEEMCEAALAVMQSEYTTTAASLNNIQHRLTRIQRKLSG